MEYFFWCSALVYVHFETGNVFLNVLQVQLIWLPNSSNMFSKKVQIMVERTLATSTRKLIRSSQCQLLADCLNRYSIQIRRNKAGYYYLLQQTHRIDILRQNCGSCLQRYLWVYYGDILGSRKIKRFLTETLALFQ